MSKRQLIKRNDPETINSFFLTGENPVLIVDRSTLENWSVCPLQGSLSGSQIATNAMEAGSASHEAIARAVAEYIASEGSLSPSDLRTELDAYLKTSRPDLADDVFNSVKRSVYTFSDFLARQSPVNILRFDSGEGERSGQLAYDISTGSHVVRVTSELDLLFAGPQPTLLHEIDWKTGRTRWTRSDVASSFQFQLHAWLIFQNYPDVEAVEISVWMTQMTQQTFPVLVERKDLHLIASRVYTAALEYSKNHALAKPPAWPTLEKCESCRVAMNCEIGRTTDVATVEDDPVNAVKELAALNAQAKAYERALAKLVDKDGEIELGDGEWFGREKPSTRKKPVATYKTCD
jgi:hypothetical protein